MLACVDEADFSYFGFPAELELWAVRKLEYMASIGLIRMTKYPVIGGSHQRPLINKIAITPSGLDFLRQGIGKSGQS